MYYNNIIAIEYYDIIEKLFCFQSLINFVFQSLAIGYNTTRTFLVIKIIKILLYQSTQLIYYYYYYRSFQ